MESDQEASSSNHQTTSAGSFENKGAMELLRALYLVSKGESSHPTEEVLVYVNCELICFSHCSVNILY